LCQERATRLPDLEQTVHSKKAEAQQVFDDEYQTAIVEFTASKDGLEDQTKQARERIAADYEIEKQAAEQEFVATRRRVRGRYAKEKDRTKTAFQEAQWTLAALLEAKKNDADAHYKDVQNQVAATMSRLQAIRQEARRLLEHWRMPVEYADGSLLDPTDPRTRPKLRRLASCLADAEGQLAHLQSQRLPRYSKGWRLPALILVVWAAMVFPAKAILNDWIIALPITGVIAAIAGILIEALLTSVARQRAARVCMRMCRAIADADPSRQRVVQHYYAVCQHEQAKLKRRHDRSLRKAYKEYRARRETSKRRRAEGLVRVQDVYEKRLAANEWRRTDDLRQAEESHQLRRAEIHQHYESASRAAHERHKDTLADIKTRYDDERADLAKRWEEGIARAQAEFEALNKECAQRFPQWDDVLW